MTLHVHALRGCTPAPLAHYLKALGVLRLIAAQADSGARGWWKDDVFHVATKLDQDELLRFICDEYAPTPMLSPWNGGSGFYPKDTKDGIDAIADSSAGRFASYRDAITVARRQLAGRPESPKKEEKEALLAACVRSWEEPASAWTAAAVSLDHDGSPRYPALLGTGGNDGRLDFTNNFMQRLVESIDVDTGAARTGNADLATLALFGGATHGLVSGCAIGQFLPGAAGGANGTAGFDATSLINPWDFILMLEGALTFRVAALRKLQGSDLAQAAAAFAVRGVCEGYASAADSDLSARGEQWAPLWSRPATADEVAALFAEGRLCSGRSSATSALDASRAVARLGSARGVTAFARYAFLERNGQSNLAVPLATVAVQYHPEVRLLDEVDGWLDALRRAARDDTAPNGLARSARRIEGLALATCGAEAGRAAWEALLVELAATEDAFIRRGRATAKARLRPLPALSAGWLAAIDDGSVEVRLALAIASQHAPALGPIRVHCLPLDPKRQYARFATAGSADHAHLVNDPRVVWGGHDLATDLAAIAVRRGIEGQRHERGALPLFGRAFASPGDVAAFVEGRTDDARISRLARALMALDWSAVHALPRVSDAPANALHALVRVAYLPQRIRGLVPRNDPTALRLLAAGRLSDGIGVAIHRLVAMGLRPRLRIAAGSSQLAVRLAATCAIPLSPRDLETLVSTVAKPFVSVDSSQEAP